MGIPKSEIAFVHDAGTDAKRRKLFEAVNHASVRVLIGSTSKLGTGVNVQKRLIGIHHLDIPYPSFPPICGSLGPDGRREIHSCKNDCKNCK